MTDVAVRYHIHTAITAVREQFDKVYISGTGKEAVFADVSRGWFVHFAGSWEALSVGPDKPDFDVGDKVHITFMKEE